MSFRQERIRGFAALSVAVSLALLGCDDENGGDDAGTSMADASNPGDGGGAADAGVCTPNFEPVSTSVRDTGGTLRVYDLCDVTVHTYTVPEMLAGNTLTIIETANQLVLIDAHFAPFIAADFRSYAESLGKPIERMIITHEHADHWAGLTPTFADLRIYATPTTISLLSTGALPSFQSFGGQGVPVVPTIELAEGIETIDGIEFEFLFFEDAEAAQPVVTRLPGLGLVVAGDIIYNGYLPSSIRTLHRGLRL